MYGTYILNSLFFIKSTKPIGFLRYERYNPNPEQKKKTCTPVPPIAAAFATIDGQDFIYPWSKCINTIVKIENPLTKDITS